jgi:uncharacterized protein YeaO (DUF488 family)
MIRVECYLAVLQKWKSLFPGAHFEIVTRGGGINSVLSPSWLLLGKYKANHNWEEFVPQFIAEMKANPKALQRMQELRELAETQDVFLVCYEKYVGKSTKCHRMLLRDLVNDYI